MDLSAFVRLLRRWLWFIALTMVIAASGSFIVSRTQPTQYQASTTIQVGSFLSLANPNTGLIQVGQQLAQNYAAIVKTYPVLEATVNKLQLPFSPDDLEKLFDTRIVPNTSLLTITVTYTDPVIVADISDELATQLILNSPTNLSKEQQDQAKLLQREITDAEAQLQTSRDELASIEKQLNDNPTDEQRTNLSARRTELVNAINAAQANLAQLTNTLATLQQQGNSNTLTVVEKARIPNKPVGPLVAINVLVATLFGGILGTGIVFLLEYLNDTIRAPSEVMPLLGLPLIGTIAPIGKKGTYKDKLVVWTQPRSTVAEAYRALRVNLMYTVKDETEEARRVYIVTSPGPAEGKSVTAANMAISFAHTGMRVLLIDADMRRPAQHVLFDVPNNVGLTSVLTSPSFGKNKVANTASGSTGPMRHFDGTGTNPMRRTDANPDTPTGENRTPDSYDQAYGKLLMANLAQKTIVPGLELIPSGPSRPNPSELLGTIQMQALVRTLSTNVKFDVVIFDTPPALTVSDSSVLANIVGAEVILVLEAGRTRRAAAIRAIQQLASLSIPVAGAVMNRLNPRDVDSGYGYYYYNYYGYGISQGEQEVRSDGSDGVRPIPALTQSARARRSEQSEASNHENSETQH